MSTGQIVLFIIASILVIVCAYYSTYYLATKTGKMKSGRTIKMRDRFSISKDKSICLLEVKDKVYLVALTNQNVTLLDKLDLEEFDSQSVAQQNSSVTAKYEPQGILQKGIFNVFTSACALIKNRARPEVNKNGSTSVRKPGKIPGQAPADEDNLDLVYQRIQNRRSNTAASESHIDEENFK